MLQITSRERRITNPFTAATVQNIVYAPHFTDPDGMKCYEMCMPWESGWEARGLVDVTDE